MENLRTRQNERPSMHCIPLINNCKHQYGNQFSLGFPAKRGISFLPKILHIFAFGLLAKNATILVFFSQNFANTNENFLIFSRRFSFAGNPSFHCIIIANETHPWNPATQPKLMVRRETFLKRYVALRKLMDSNLT